jgi:asparagine synthase (glutamine-hydrolysing)
MPDPRYDESGFAAACAVAIGSDHTTLDCDGEPASDLVRLIHTLGLPFGDSSLLPSYWVSAAARQSVKVALSGDGGDELFIGYDRYWAADRLLKAGLLAWLPAGWIPARDPKSWTAKAARLINAARGMGYLDLISVFPTQDLRRLLGRSERTELPNQARAGGNIAVAWDVMHYLPDDLLRKTDSASMQHSLEVRCPFLDPLLAVACLSAPLQDLIPGGQRKGLLRAIARRYLPAEIVDRPKQGFAIPIGEWFRTDYGGMKQLLMDHLGSAEPWGPASLGIDLNMAFVRRMIDEHMNEKRDHSQRLYMLLVLSIWAKWVGGLSRQT